MLVRLAMTLSTVHGWSLPEPVDGKASSLSSHEHAQESAITGGVDGSRDRRQLAPPGCFSCDESCDGCDASCDGFWGWGDLARDGCDSSCDFACDAGAAGPAALAQAAAPAALAAAAAAAAAFALWQL